MHRFLGAVPSFYQSLLNERVIVTLAGQTVRAIAACDGRWLVRLPSLPAGLPASPSAPMPCNPG